MRTSLNRASSPRKHGQTVSISDCTLKFRDRKKAFLFESKPISKTVCLTNHLSEEVFLVSRLDARYELQQSACVMYQHSNTSNDGNKPSCAKHHSLLCHPFAQKSQQGGNLPHIPGHVWSRHPRCKVPSKAGSRPPANANLPQIPRCQKYG